MYINAWNWIPAIHVFYKHDYMFREEEEDELEDETEEAETQLFLPESMIENKIPPAGVANSPVKEWGGQLNKYFGFT